MIDKQFAEKQYLDHERIKEDRLNRYRTDIKRQIDEKERQKLQDKLQGNLATSYMNLTYEEIQKRLCSSCEREYPKNYLTRYKRKRK